MLPSGSQMCGESDTAKPRLEVDRWDERETGGETKEKRMKFAKTDFNVSNESFAICREERNADKYKEFIDHK